MKKLLTVLLFTGAAHAAVIADVRVAPGVAVVEPDLLTVLTTRVAEAGEAGLFKEKSRKARERFQSAARRPVDLKLPRAEESREFSRELVTAESLAAIEQETTRQALTSFSRTYLFIDVDDAAERGWALREMADSPAARLVAVAGDLGRALAEKSESSLSGTRLFADQGAVLVRRFGVMAHPARVDLQGTATGVSARGREARLSQETEGRQ